MGRLKDDRKESTEKAPYTGADNLEAMLEARNYNAFLIDQVMSHSGGAKTALDFGAGCGTFARALRDLGVNVVCVEPDDALRNSLQNQGFTCLESLDQVPPGSVDYFYSLNVFEHIENDTAILGELCRRLRPGGRLYLYLPAFPMLYTSMDRKVGHLRRYRLRPLCMQLKQAGYQVTTARYADSLGFFVTLAYRVLGNRRGDLNLKALRFFDRWLFPVSRLLDRVLGRWVGKNVAVAAMRPRTEATESPGVKPPVFERRRSTANVR